MKKALIFSLVLNFLAVGFYLGKRYYFSHGAGARNGPNFYDQWNSMRTSLYSDLNIDSADIVFVGNSLTEGFPVTEIYGQRVKNRGVGGNCTSHLLKRIRSIAVRQPKKIFIEIGVNDFSTGGTVVSAFDNYRGIINAIKEVSPGTQIYVQSVFPTCFGFSGIIGNIKSLNDKLRRYCNEQGIVYVDIYNAMIKNNFLDTTLTSDGIHLNGMGYAIWERNIRQYLN